MNILKIASKLTLFGGLGVATGAGIAYLKKIEQPQAEINEELAINIYKDLVKETYPLYWQKGTLISNHIFFKKQALARSGRQNPLTKEEIREVAQEVYDFYPFLHSQKEEIVGEVASKYKTQFKKVSEFVEKSIKSGKMSPELRKWVANQNQLVYGSLEGSNIVLPAEVPDFLTIDYVSRARLECDRLNLREIADLVKSYITSGRQIVGNKDYAIDVGEKIDNLRILTERLNRDYPQLYELEYHPANYFFLAENKFREDPASGYEERFKALRVKFGNSQNQIIGGKATLKEIDELIADFDDFDPMVEFKNKGKK